MDHKEVSPGMDTVYEYNIAGAASDSLTKVFAVFFIPKRIWPCDILTLRL